MKIINPYTNIRKIMKIVSIIGMYYKILHSMAMGNLNKSKETTPTTKGSTLEGHFPQELKSPLSDLSS